MSTKISLANHISKTKTSAVTKICKNLFETTNITYFCYLRRYKNGFFTFLPTAIDLGSYLFEDGLYPYTWFAGTPFNDLKSGFTFWDICKQVSSAETQNISQELAKTFNLSVGIEIIDKQENYCDFYSFSGCNPAIYSVSIQYLYEYIYYFKQESHSLLLTAHEDKLPLQTQNIAILAAPIINLGREKAIQANNDLQIQRYYLTDEIFLTKREVEILRKMDKGETAKCVAASLDISTRTLEQHITNIKSKLNVSRTAEIVYIAKNNKILP